jgi:hypothetical protein
LKVLTEYIDDKLTKSEEKQNDEYININNSLGEHPMPRKSSFKFFHELTRSILYTIALLLHYFLMLISMTFNVGLFIAIIAGAFFGMFHFYYENRIHMIL